MAKKKSEKTKPEQYGEEFVPGLIELLNKHLTNQTSLPYTRSSVLSVIILAMRFDASNFEYDRLYNLFEEFTEAEETRNDELVQRALRWIEEQQKRKKNEKEFQMAPPPKDSDLDIHHGYIGNASTISKDDTQRSSRKKPAKKAQKKKKPSKKKSSKGNDRFYPHAEMANLSRKRDEDEDKFSRRKKEKPSKKAPKKKKPAKKKKQNQGNGYNPRQDLRPWS